MDGYGQDTDNLARLLEAKEGRYLSTLRLVKIFKTPAITIRANLPGFPKATPHAKYLVKLFTSFVILQQHTVAYKRYLETPEGYSYQLFVPYNPLVLKKAMIELEQTHELGRLVDLDVTTIEGKELGRSDFCFKPRSCLMCDEIAYRCMREGRHDTVMLRDAFNHRIEKYLAQNKLNLMAEIAILDEGGLQ